MSSRPTLRAMLWRWRRLIAAALVALCAAIAVASIGSSGRMTPVELLVAGGDMPAGHTLSDSDVRFVQAPSGTIPEELVPEDVAGRRLSVAVQEGTPMTESMLIGPTLSDSAPDGTVILAIHLLTPEELIPVGSTVDLWATDEAGTAYKAASAATIMAFSESADASAFGWGATDATYSYVAVADDDATFVLGISARSPLMAVLHR